MLIKAFPSSSRLLCLSLDQARNGPKQHADQHKYRSCDIDIIESYPTYKARNQGSKKYKLL